MSDWMKKILPPKPGTTGDTQVRKVPKGPSKKVRDDYMEKVRQKIKEKKKKEGG